MKTALVALPGQALLGWRRFTQKRKLHQEGIQTARIACDGLSLQVYANQPPAGSNQKIVQIWQAHPPAGPLVFLHGFLDSSLTFRSLLPAIARAHPVLAIDIPGFGGSYLPAIRELWQIDAMARTISRLLFETLALQRVQLVAHSMGAVLAAHVYRWQQIRYPGGRITGMHWLAPGVFRLAAKEQDALASFFYPRDATGLQHLLSSLSYKERPPLPGFIKLALLREWSGPGLQMLKANTLERERSIFFEREQLQRLRVPVDLYWGRQDQITPLSLGRKIHKAIPESRLHIIEAAGHTLHLDQRTALLNTLLPRL
ncbi:MAG: alpha/beta fold hydrolase [Leptospiraceae bacterium]|nr:alpha/beta fold hydrolase [Leptospiraceae bacterium]